MIIMSTVLNTSAKVIAQFGGTTWTQISGRFLLAANSTYAVKSTGGTTTHTHTTGNHTLTIDEMPSHTHVQNQHRHGAPKQLSDTAGSNWAPANAKGTPANYYTDYTTATNQNTGKGGSHNHGNTGSSGTFPAYYAVYIWERTA